MKVLRDGKEVKNASIVYSSVSGRPELVTVDGVNYDPSAFTFEDAKSVKKTKEAPKTVNKTDGEKPKPAASDSVMTTGDLTSK